MSKTEQGEGKSKTSVAVITAVSTVLVAIVTAIIGPLIAGKPPTGPKTTTTILSAANADTINVALRLENEKSYPAIASKRIGSAPLVLIDGSKDTDIYFEEVKGSVIYSVNAKRISGPDDGRQTDLTTAYKKGSPVTLCLDVTYLFAFDTEQGIFYIKAKIDDVFPSRACPTYTIPKSQME